MRPVFFATPSRLREWLRAHHAAEKELWVGYFKKTSGKPSVTWPESVDEALCVGWIDGIRRSLNAESYTIRFTPRRAGSIWSTVNIRRARTLAGAGRMRAAGRKALDARRENKSGIYSYEQREARLAAPYEGILAKNRAAWNFFEAQPVSYRKAAGWWVVSAKREDTRRRRLAALIRDSARGRRIAQFTRRESKGPARSR